MKSIIVLGIMTVFGWSIKDLFQIDSRKLLKSENGKGLLIPTQCFDVPFSLIVGITFYTTLNFFFSWGFSAFGSFKLYPLFYSNILSIIISLAIISIAFYKRAKKNAVGNQWRNSQNIYFVVVVGIFLLFLTHLFYYSFYVKNDILHTGFTVFSDFAPHTAVVSSFSVGSNFPVSYPHFANDNINYHFFFFYLAANLRYLGLRFDHAINIPSIIGALSFIVLLGSLAVSLSKRRIMFFIAPAMIFLRSSMAFFTHLKEIIPQNNYNPISIIKELINTDIFIGNTVHDDWGLWALNVYANQRHLLWGFSIILIIFILFLPTLKENFQVRGINDYLIKRELWVPKNIKNIILACLLIFIMPYWHGSMVLIILCIFFILAFFSHERLSYIIFALSAIAGTLIFARIFSGGSQNIANPQIYWGFISPDKSLLGVVLYLFQVIGISLVLYVLSLFLIKGYKNKALILAFFAPLIFALTVSLTPDVTVNHKYILASVILLNIFAGMILVKMFDFTIKTLRRSFNSRIKNYTLKPLIGVLFSVLCIGIFFTGIIEYIGYINKNENTFKIDLNSELTSWVMDNTETDDIFLTAPYHMNEFFFSGRKVFYGWTYYTWTAGHDTFKRDIIYRELLYGSKNLKEFENLTRQHNLKYIILDDELINSNYYYINEEFFRSNFEKVFESSNKEKTIYQLFD